VELNTREVAILMWATAALILCLVSDKLRRSLVDVIRAFFQRKFITIIVLLYLYISFVVALIWSLGLWEWDQLKNTLIFSVAVGIASLLRLPSIRDDLNLYRHWIADNLRIIVVVEFVVTFHTFNIAIELVLIPLFALFGGMLAVGATDKKYSAVVRFLNGLTATFGFFLIGYAVYAIASEPESFWSWQTLRDFYTPIILSFLLLPFIQVLHIYTTYETLFIHLERVLSDKDLRFYAKRRAILAFGPSNVLLNRWKRHIFVHRPKDRSDIDCSIREIVNARQRENYPHEVARSEGWSPYVAKDFLRKDGFVTSDYHRAYDEWFASSPYKELGDGIIPDNVAYYIEGDELIAKRLKLVLHVNNPKNSRDSRRQFRQLVQTLTDAAIGGYQLPNEMDHFEMCADGKRLIMRRADWKGGIVGGYDIKFQIEVE
jgi:hypothetical protein